jgi:hypothetical protein
MAHQNRRSIIRSEFEPAEDLAGDILATWVGPMARLDWPQRLELLQEISRLVANRPGLASIVTARLIEHLGAGAIQCRAQALFYLHSADETYRGQAERWAG